MAVMDPAAVATKWATNLGASTTSITAGVNAVQQAPGQSAAAQSAVWLQRLQASQAKWERNVSAVTLQEWKNAMLNKGLPRIATGAQQAVPKMQAFMQKWLPYEQAGVAQLPPRGTVQQNIQRAVNMMNWNAGFIP
jgi:hypothetical protein